MNIKRFLPLLLLIPLLVNQPVLAQSTQDSQYSRSEAAIEVSADRKEMDKRAQILQAYLAKYNSDLQYNAQDFVDAADQYNLNWKLVAAISGVESTFGKRVPGGTEPQFTSYNGWGWGVYGTKAMYFTSWRDGIFTVSEGLRKNYLDKGLTDDPFVLNKRYAASPVWGSKVTYFLKDMEKFEAEYKAKESLATSID